MWHHYDLSLAGNFVRFVGFIMITDRSVRGLGCPSKITGVTSIRFYALSKSQSNHEFKGCSSANILLMNMIASFFFYLFKQFCKPTDIPL